MNSDEAASLVAMMIRYVDIRESGKKVEGSKDMR